MFLNTTVSKSIYNKLINNLSNLYYLHYNLVKIKLTTSNNHIK